MSSYQYTPPDQDFNAESFGQPMYEQPKRGGGGRAFLFSCGGLALIGVLICFCCAGVIYYVSQQPLAVAAVWGAGAGSDWTLANDVVCPGSQAERLTQDYQNSGAVIQNFSSTTGDLSATSLEVTGTLVEDGVSEPWSATMTTSEEGAEGFFPACVDQITVHTGN